MTSRRKTASPADGLRETTQITTGSNFKGIPDSAAGKDLTGLLARDNRNRSGSTAETASEDNQAPDKLAIKIFSLRV